MKTGESPNSCAVCKKSSTVDELIDKQPIICAAIAVYCHRGEKYVGCRLPSLYLLKVQLELDVESSTSAGTAIKQIFGIPESLSVGQVTFSPDGFRCAWR